MLLVLFGFQVESIEAIGLIDIVLSLLYTVLIYNSCERFRWLGKYEKGLFEHWSLQNKPWAGEFMKMSIPLSIGHILSHGHWFIWTWFAIAMGPGEAAAWIIMQALGVVLAVLPTAVTNATEIQIGLTTGNGRTDSARQISMRSLVYVVIASALPIAVFYGLRNTIISFITNEQGMVFLLNELVPLLCTGTVIHALASHTQMILGSIGRAKAGIVIFYTVTYCISLPLATVMVFVANFGLPSLMMSVVIGQSIIAFANLLAVYSSDWSSLSRTVLMKAEKHCKALIEMTDDHRKARKVAEMC
jgi:Na+-driven multidrug efflux pump